MFGTRCAEGCTLITRVELVHSDLVVSSTVENCLWHAGVVENRVLHRIELLKRVGCVGTRGHVRARTTREHPAHQRRWEIDRSMALQIRTSRFFHAERIPYTNGIRTNLRQRFSNCECRSCHNVKMNCQMGNESRIVMNCLEL